MPKIKEVKRMTGAMRTIHLGRMRFAWLYAVITSLYIGHPYYQTLLLILQLINMLWLGIDGDILLQQLF